MYGNGSSEVMDTAIHLAAARVKIENLKRLGFFQRAKAQLSTRMKSKPLPPELPPAGNSKIITRVYLQRTLLVKTLFCQCGKKGNPPFLMRHTHEDAMYCSYNNSPNSPLPPPTPPLPAQGKTLVSLVGSSLCHMIVTNVTGMCVIAQSCPKDQSHLYMISASILMTL